MTKDKFIFVWFLSNYRYNFGKYEFIFQFRPPGHFLK